MRICVAFLLVLLFLSCVPVQAEINPSVDTKPFFCRYTLTDWTPLCPTVGTGGAGSGSTFVNAQNSTFYYNSTTNETTIYGNTTSFFNTTIGNNLTTFSNYTYWYLVNITYSEMNQTPGEKGDKGDDGYTPIFGVDYFNGSAGPQGVNGTPGLNGTPGAPGEKGDKGDTGAQGPAGPAGADGAANMTAGPQGEQGPQGIQGPTGPANMTAGPQGSQGEQGLQGIQGIQGEQGEPGAANMTAGPPGATGNPGATGPAGLDANVSSMYPVTSVYGTTNASADPATLLGVGTWAFFGNQTVIPQKGALKYTQNMLTNIFPFPQVASADSIASTAYDAYMAVDGQLPSGTAYLWCSGSGALPHWFQVYTSDRYIPVKYVMYPGNTVGDSPKNFTLNASTDGSTWTTLDTQTSITGWSAGVGKTFTFANTNSYNYFRITITADQAGDGAYVRIGELYLYEAESAAKIIHFWERTA